MAHTAGLLLLLAFALLSTSSSSAVGRRLLLAPAEATKSPLTYRVVGTSESTCYDDTSALAACPTAGAAWAGQDAQTKGTPPSYSFTNVTVTDKVTGLMWTRSADSAGNGDGVINYKDKFTYAAAKGVPAKLNAAKYAGYSDWRLPTVKELYSLIVFTGTDPVPTSKSTAGLRPFITTPAFKFAWGDIQAGERVIDAQYASATTYVSMPKKVFGVNFADGRIKGYDSEGGPIGNRTLTFFVLCVRGNPQYGQNDFKDNGDGTVTDAATGLMWTKADSGKGMNWKQALAWAADANKKAYLGYKDWRVPHIKELQSLVDYSRSPDTTQSPALDPVFSSTAITNEAGQKDWPYVWSSTTHVKYSNGTTHSHHGSYVAFGRGLGYLTPQSTGQTGLRRQLLHAAGSPAAKVSTSTQNPTQSPASQVQQAYTAGSWGWMDVHGAGCQRSDPKGGDPKAYPHGSGPQGDAIRICNYVRLVRTAATV